MMSVFEKGTLPPCPAPFNMAAYVLGKAGDHPDKLALRVLAGDGTSHDWTYAQLEGAVLGTASGLLGLGATPGDKILMRLGNTVDFPLAYLGALAAGLVPVPTSAALTTHEIAPIIKELDPKLVIRAPDVACPDIENCVDVDLLRTFRDMPHAPYHLGDPNRLGYVIYTSGTSGRPRAVAHAHRAIWARQMMFDGWYGLRGNDRVLHAGAFNWTYTLGTGLMDPWTIGATAIIPAPETAASDLPMLLERQDATIFAAAPGVYRQLLKSDVKTDLPTLRHGLSAGEKLPNRVRQRWVDSTGCDIYEAYGMSECSTFLSACPTDPATNDSLGRPQPGRRVAILDADGPVPLGVEGTIAVHKSDPGLMLGYLGDPDETASKMQGDWFLTGDQGLMHADDQITYLGRHDDMMNAGGYRVSPLEVEHVLTQVEGVQSVGCVAVEVKQDTFVIAAYYTAASPLDPDVIKDHAAHSLARYKQPRIYIQIDVLPTGANNKIKRNALRDLFAQQTVT
ncbi:class I adenylate-forming enzyme family protein [Ascidiaceihabitans sp.]|uniref:class I adenylate-forming enzyme family protein n=1 Tax=Ascidiaceihabitans sp. TaxID=1872644 RepID=UPI003296BD80